MNRKGTCHQLPVVLAVDGKGLQQEPKGGVSPVACGSRRVRKGATTRTEEPKGVADHLRPHLFREKPEKDAA